MKKTMTFEPPVFLFSEVFFGKSKKIHPLQNLDLFKVIFYFVPW